jgi:uncharacterized protein (DUF983 family)
MIQRAIQPGWSGLKKHCSRCGEGEAFSLPMNLSLVERRHFAGFGPPHAQSRQNAGAPLVSTIGHGFLKPPQLPCI